MKNLALAFMAVIVTLGCDSDPKILDWNKTASEQKFNVGNAIVVEGLTTNNIVSYTNTNGTVTREDPFGDPSGPLHVWAATTYKDEWNEKISIKLFNPEQPNVKENPNAPLGIVICTIYNPSHNEDLRDLYRMYPKFIVQETKIDAVGRHFTPHLVTLERVYPRILHRFRFIGTIQRIGRNTFGNVSLRYVDIDVSDITVISSEQFNKLESWRMDESMQQHLTSGEEFEKELIEDIEKGKKEMERLKKEIERLENEQNR